MAHFAQIDQNNVVIQVVAIDNENVVDANNDESEAVGVEFCQSLFGADTVWKQTSYNANIRKNYAGIGYTYDAGRDAFIPPKPYQSWVLDESSCQWNAPLQMPQDENRYYWDESAYQADNTVGWVLI